MEREQIIKALECCGADDGCVGEECPYYANCQFCITRISKDALSLIKELTEDNEAQSETITSLLKTIEGVQGVKSEYETFIGGLKSQIDAIKAEARADTVRKIQERLKANKVKRDGLSFKVVDFDTIDQIAKEMMEEVK